MNQTTILFKIDKTLKKKAQATAKELGIPLSLVFTQSFQRFVKEKEITFSADEHITPAKLRKWKKMSEDMQKGKNIGHSYTTVEDFLKSLD